VCLRDGKVIGGICFRPFTENGFLEIAFLAVSVDFQIRVPLLDLLLSRHRICSRARTRTQHRVSVGMCSTT
jgi:hypothetical protein